jgi:hypothetical protein
MSRKNSHTDTTPEIFQKTKDVPPNAKSYQSNPFFLCFDDFSVFFERNMWWAIAIIIGAFIGAILSSLSDAFRIMYEASSGKVNATAMSQVTPEQIGIFFGIGGIILFFVVILVLISMIIDVFIRGMFNYVALQNHASRSVSFNESFNAVLERFPRLFLAQLLAGLKIIAWTFLLIIPGIIAAFRYALLPYVILDESSEKKGIVDSHNRIKVLVAGRKREVFGISTVANLIPIVGPLLQLTGNAKLYRQLQVTHDNNVSRPKVHWLNYLGFILIGLFILFITGIIAIIALIIAAQR